MQHFHTHIITYLCLFTTAKRYFFIIFSYIRDNFCHNYFFTSRTGHITLYYTLTWKLFHCDLPPSPLPPLFRPVPMYYEAILPNVLTPVSVRPIRSHSLSLPNHSHIYAGDTGVPLMRTEFQKYQFVFIKTGSWENVPKALFSIISSFHIKFCISTKTGDWAFVTSGNRTTSID